MRSEWIPFFPQYYIAIKRTLQTQTPGSATEYCGVQGRTSPENTHNCSHVPKRGRGAVGRAQNNENTCIVHYDENNSTNPETVHSAKCIQIVCDTIL